MRPVYRFYAFAWACCLLSLPLAAQDTNQGIVSRSMAQTEARMDRFSRRCERRTEKALRRMEKYEKKFGNEDTGEQADEDTRTEQASAPQVNSKRKNREKKSLKFEGEPEPSLRDRRGQTQRGLGKEPLLDSLRTAYDFAEKEGLAADKRMAELTHGSLDRARDRLDETVDVKEQLRRRTAEAKARAKGHPEYARTAGKMEKEAYYYTAQINEYRKALRDPAAAEEQLMQAVKKNPRWSEYLAALPAPKQNPEKMQPKDMVRKMMQSQAAAVDPDASKLLAEAQQKGGELLGKASGNAAEFGNLDNAARMPSFTPNPYKTKSFLERIDAGFNLEFDGKTYFLPSCGVAGFQASYNFDKRWSAGVLTNYRFGMGEDLKHIRFSSMGAGYGVFVNGKLWKGLGAQAGFERNWRTAVQSSEALQFPAAWTSSALIGLTWEYGIGKRAKGTLGVFFDALHNSHTPQTNALLWRTGWKF